MAILSTSTTLDEIIRCASKWFILTQQVQNLELVNLKCVTYTQPIPLSLTKLNLINILEKVYFRSQILERPSIGEYWNISGVSVLSENVTFTFFRTCWLHSEANNTGTSKWSSIVQYSCTSIWDLKYTFSNILLTNCLKLFHNLNNDRLVIQIIRTVLLKNNKFCAKIIHLVMWY